MTEQVKIIVAFHKRYPHSHSSAFLNVHVGKELSKESLEFIGDNTGEHISALNPYFCELTALYWALHNSQFAAITGLCHYRRYFNLTPSWFQSFKKENKVKSGKFDFGELSDYEAICTQLLSGADIILPKKTNLKKSIETHYLDSHLEDEWRTMVQIVEELYPDYNAGVFFKTAQFMHEYNMYISSRALTEKYLNWLFSILFELHKRIKPSSNPYQRRSIGFLSERLLNLFVYKNNLKIREFPVFYLKD
jgi:hypothetical protein